MKMNNLLVAFGGLIGLSGMAVAVASQAQESAKVDATCVKCFITYYPNGGGTVQGCRADQNPPSNNGAVYCVFSGPGSCYTAGYGSCS